MEYKVVKIVDEYLIVVNYGLNNGARENEILEVIKTGDIVFDPDTQESLGTLDMIKGQVKIINVYENMSLCRSNEKTINYNSGLANFASAMYSLSNTLSTTEVKALNVNTKEISGGYDRRSDLIVSIGDSVKIKKLQGLSNEEGIEDGEENVNDEN